MGNSLDIRLLGDRVLIDCSKDKGETVTKSGVIVKESDSSLSKTSKKGVVVAVGPGGITDSGASIPMAISVGDNVLFMFGEELYINGASYYLARLAEVHAVLPQEVENSKKDQ